MTSNAYGGGLSRLVGRFNRTINSGAQRAVTYPTSSVFWRIVNGCDKGTPSGSPTFTLRRRQLGIGTTWPDSPEVLRDVRAGVPVGLHPLRRGNVHRVLDPPGTPELGAVGAGSLPLHRSTLFYQVTLVLGEGPEGTDHHAPCGSGRVDAISDRHQGDATFSERLDCLQDVQCVAAQAVKLPHHHGVAVPHVFHQRGQAACTRHGVGECLRHSCRFKGRVLLIEGLRDRGGTGLADAGTRTGAAASGIACLTHKCWNTAGETGISETDY